MTEQFDPYRCDRCPWNIVGKEEKVLKTANFIRKPLLVEGIQVTPHNMVEVAQWCGGELHMTPSRREFIKLQVKPSPMTRQHMAFAGDWVLKSDMGFKIYSKRAFERTFDPSEN